MEKGEIGIQFRQSRRRSDGVVGGRVILLLGENGNVVDVEVEIQVQSVINVGGGGGSEDSGWVDRRTKSFRGRFRSQGRIILRSRFRSFWSKKKCSFKF